MSSERWTDERGRTIVLTALVGVVRDVAELLVRPWPRLGRAGASLALAVVIVQPATDRR